MHPLWLGNFIIETLLFLCVLYFYFYLPGKWLLRKLGLTTESTESVVLPTTLGIILFSLTSYIASWVHFLPIILLPIAAIAITSLRKIKIKKIEYPPRQEIFRLVFITILAILFSLPRTTAGIWGDTFSPAVDDTLHLAYIHELLAHFPPDHPGFAGIPLRGYHFFLDFFISSVSRLSTIPVTSLYFHYVPLLVSFGIAFGIYSLIVMWTKRAEAGLWAVFLGLFGGSFGFILRLQGHPEASLTSVFGMDQAPTAIHNPPFAFSLLLIICALILVLHYTRERKIGWLFLLALIVGVAPIFKIYAGILLFAGFSFLTLWELIHKRYQAILPYIFSIGIALTTYGVFSGPGNYLIYLPLWAPHRMLTANLPWYGFEEKYYTYTKLGVIRGLIEIELYGLALFIFGNLGTRLFGLVIHGVAWLKKRHAPACAGRPSLFACVFASMIATSILIPLFFIQSVKVFEIIQLAFYFPFLCALVAAYGITQIHDLRIPKTFRWILIGIMVLMTLPSAYQTFTSAVLLPKTRTPLSDFRPYDYLQTHGMYDETVLELPPPSVKNSKESLIQWHHTTSARFSAFGNKRSFFNSTEIDFPNLDIDGRAQFLREVLMLASPSGYLQTDQLHGAELAKNLKSAEIKYIYSSYPLSIASLSAHLKKIFSSGGTFIYLVQ